MRRSLAFHTIIYALGSLGSRLIGFIMLPIYTRKLTPVDYGEYELLAVTTSILGILLDAGVGSAVTRFYHRHDASEQRNLVVSTAHLFLVGIFAVSVGVLFLSSSAFGQLVLGRSDGGHLFRLTFLTLCLDGAATVPLTYFRAEERSRLVVTFSLLRLFVALALNILFVVVLDMQLEGVLWSGVITACGFAVAANWLMVRRTGLGFRGEYLRDMLRFGLPLVPGTLAYLVIHSGDRYFLKYYADSAEVGRYGLAYKFGMLVTYLVGANFNAIWITRGLALFKQGSVDAVARVFEKYLLVLLWFWVGLSVLAEDILAVMVGREFRGVHTMIALVGLGYVLRSCADYFRMPLNFTYRSKRDSLVIMASGAVSVLFYWAFIGTLGALGAALATAATFAVMAALMYRSGQDAVRVSYRAGPTAYYTVVAAAYVLLCRALPLGAGPVRFALLSLVALSYPLVAARGTVTEQVQLLRARFSRAPAGAPTEAEAVK
jgi:O-antigen/teichoic acid export membrane protein